MIDLKDLREHPDKYRTGCANKNYDPAVIDQLLDLDEQCRKLTAEREQLTAEKNRIGKQIGQIAGWLNLLKSGKQSADGLAKPVLTLNIRFPAGVTASNAVSMLEQRQHELRERPAEIKQREQELTDQLAEWTPKRQAMWLEIPQPADSDVPVGRSAEDNVELRCWNPPHYDAARSFADNRGFVPRSHIDLMQAHGMVDLERGVKIAGSRSYILVGHGMRLHSAILRFAFDFMTNRNGFVPLSVPDLVRHDMMVGTGFFPHGREQVYDIANPTGEVGLALSGTGEVGLMGYHADEILEEAALPRCYTTVSTCFRREAGAAGKDTAGLYRIHQFDKVEQVVICKADEAESRAWHRKMIGFVEAILQELELPYRLLQCCTGDLGPKNADMIDIECWMPSRGEAGADGVPTGEYGETHSASRLYDYQCRRLNIRYKDEKTGRNVICHSLNNTVAASPRILIPIIEMYQNADGTITVPQALRPYMNGAEKIG